MQYFLKKYVLKNLQLTFVNKIGATVFTKNVSVSCFSFTRPSLVNFELIPALLNRTFNPALPTFSATTFIILS